MHCKCGVRNYNNNGKSIQEEDKVLGKRCVICAFPSRWYMGDGSKVRMVAFIDKDDMNDVDIDIPVSKEFYDSVEVGTVLDDSFRMGSFIMSGSYGSWDISISDKRVE